MRFAAKKLATARAAVSTMQAGAVELSPWLDLLIRIALGRTFLTTAIVGIVMHAPPAMVSAGAMSHAINTVVASSFGMVVQALCPTLLLVGVFSRGAALLLLVQVVLLTSATPHPFLILLLGRILFFGPGSISLDAALRDGIVTSALPIAARLHRAVSDFERLCKPAYNLLFRLWLAAAPLALAGLIALPSWSLRLDSAQRVIAPAVALTLSALLLLGLGTRAAAIALAVIISGLQPAMGANDRMFWLLALALLAVNGAGPLSLDARLFRRLRRWSPAPTADDMSLPRVVIVGGGFAGVAAARGLAGAACRVTLIDRRNHHLFQPLLYQVATAGLSPADIATPIRSLFRQQPNVHVRLGHVDGVRPDVKQALLGDERIDYDYLVLATGAQHSYFGRNDWAALAPGLKTIEDATEIRRRLLTAFERAEIAADPSERAAWLTFVIVGGGPTGVELAGAIAELARHGLANEFRSIDPTSARVVLIHAGSRVLPTFAETLSGDAADALRELGVDVRLDASVGHVDEFGVTVGQQRVAARTVLWAAGVAASPAGQWVGAKTDRAGRIPVEANLSLAEHSDVFAIGDVAASSAWNGKPVPGLAPAAKQAGAHAAKVIRARIAGQAPPDAFRYRHSGSLATIGRRAAVAEFGSLRFHGALAWWLWGAAHILFLIGGRNRAVVALQWLWAYLTYGRGIRLIVDSRALR
jgi:NADH dehydrogenase/putative oxidoreductase